MISFSGIIGLDRKGTDPCSIDKKPVKDEAIFCDGCGSWFHRRCQHLTLDHLGALAASEYQYLCLECCQGEDGSYDYKKALGRLSCSAKDGLASLEAAVVIERILLREEPLLQPRVDGKKDKKTLVQDVKATEYLFPYGGNSRAAARLPVEVTGDGNYLYNSISVALAGNESLAPELRLRICMEMVLSAKTYQERYPMLGMSSSDYSRDCLDAAMDGSYSTVWSIAAAASVIGREVFSIYPPVNGLLDMYAASLTTVFQPFTGESGVRITLMWTRMREHKGQIWTPDHFVPLLPAADIDCHRPEQKRHIDDSSLDTCAKRVRYRSPVRLHPQDNYLLGMSDDSGDSHTTEDVLHLFLMKKYSKNVSHIRKRSPILSGKLGEYFHKTNH